MRLRFAVLALLSSALVSIAVPAGALAHGPRHNHGLTIAATPNPIISGEGVLIYGQLNGSNHSGQTIYLYHRVNPAHSFTLIGTTTDARERVLRIHPCRGRRHDEPELVRPRPEPAGQHPQPHRARARRGACIADGEPARDRERV